MYTRNYHISNRMSASILFLVTASTTFVYLLVALVLGFCLPLRRRLGGEPVYSHLARTKNLTVSLITFLKLLQYNIILLVFFRTLHHGLMN